MDRRDFALEAAFTSMSLRERCRDPGVVCTLVLTSLPSTHRNEKSLQFNFIVINTLCRRMYVHEKEKT